MNRSRRTALLTFARLALVSVPVGALAVYYGAVVIWARDVPWAPVTLAAHLGDLTNSMAVRRAIVGPIMGSSVAAVVFVAVAALTTFACVFLWRIPARQSLAVAAWSAFGYAVGVGLLYAVPGSFIDGIPGYTSQAWVIFLACGILAAGAAAWMASPARFHRHH